MCHDRTLPQPDELTLDNLARARGWDDDDVHEYYLPDVVENIRTRLESRLPDGSRFSFTALQRQALTTPEFWQAWDEGAGDPSHIIIQGSTSAGKTLVSEMAVLDALCHKGKVLVLVPLRAMVHERTERFRSDMESCPRSYRVYGSSADYLENDDRIIHNDYDVAVVVYEKFFSMLSVPDCHVLDDCKLIVVDELSMLSKDDRGPKLEISLEIVKERSPQTRIMCLVTSDCRTSKVAAWLDCPTVINNPTRPVGLDEYVIRTDGSYRHRLIPGELENAEETGGVALFEDEGAIEVGGYNGEERFRQQKRRALLAILSEVVAQQDDARILVFVAGQRDTVSTAQFIRDNLRGLFPRVDISDEMRVQLQTFEMDDDRKTLEEELLPFGIAYHHAGVSTALRECIEEEFQRRGSNLRVICATETLAMGINMPFDVMVMLDNEIPSGPGERHVLTYQEYRNYIGRAGRLGQSNRRGASYLVVCDQQTQDHYWFAYRRMVKTGGDEIESALKGSDEKTQAPYLLALAVNAMGGRSFSVREFEQMLKGLHDEGFAHACSPGDLDAGKIVDFFERHKFCRRETDPFEDDADVISFTNFGKHLAPFALSLDTCRLIYNYFGRVTAFGLPRDATAGDIESNRYLLELLYHLCQHQELERAGYLALPEREHARAQVATIVPARVRELVGDGSGLWATPDNPFGSIRELSGSHDLATEVLDLDRKLQAAMRALVLYWWVRGEQTSDIRKKSGLGKVVPINNGGLERLASVVSYHLDAIYHVMADVLPPFDSEARRQLYWLQVRVKYGMPNSGVALANKHVHGLDRPRILNFINFCKERGETPLEVLFTIPDSDAVPRFFTKNQLTLLRRRNTSRRSGKSFETILEGLKGESNVTEEQIEKLEALHEADAGDFFELLCDLIDTDPDRLAMPRIRMERASQGSVARLYWDDHRVYLGLWSSETANDVRGTFLEAKRESAGYVTCAVMGNHSETAGTPECDLLITRTFFDLLMLKAVAFDRNGIAALKAFLLDSRGSFDEGDFVNALDLPDYFPLMRTHKGRPQVRILTHRPEHNYGTISHKGLEDALKASDDLSPIEYLSFDSTSLGDIDDALCVVHLSRREIQRSRAATALVKHLMQTSFRNCLILLDSETEEASWRGLVADMLDDPLELPWNRGLTSVPRDSLHVVSSLGDCLELIRTRLLLDEHEGFLVGVSFARTDTFGDAERFGMLVDRLSAEFGRHRMLYCGYQENQALFAGARAQEDSLDAYRECALYLVLDNDDTAHSPICALEREVINAQVSAHKAECLYVKGTISGRLVPKGGFSVGGLDIDPDKLVAITREKLAALRTIEATQ